MSAHVIEVPVDTSAEDTIGLLGHGRPGWLRPFLLLAQRSVGRGLAGDVSYQLGDAGDGSRATALRWRPDAGPEVFTAFTGRLEVHERAGQVMLALDGDARGGDDRANAALLTRLLDLIAGALAEAGLGVR